MRATILILCVLFLPLLCSCAKQHDFSIRFISDRQYDQMMIFRMFQGKDPAGLKSRSKQMGFDYGFAKEVSKAESYEVIEPKLTDLVDRTYLSESDLIQKSQEEYAKSWDPVIEVFSRRAQELSGSPWFYRNYECVVSPFHKGLSSWYSNTITRAYNEDPLKQRRITAHEIVLSHIFHIVRQRYSEAKLSNWRVWAFAEITTVFILDDPELMQKLWPWQTIKENYFSQSNYPQLARLEDQLRKIWISRKDFDDYMTRAVPILKTFSTTHRKGM